MISELESGLSALGWTVLALDVLGKDGVHVVSDAITALVTHAPDLIQPGDQCIELFDEPRVVAYGDVDRYVARTPYQGPRLRKVDDE